MVELYILTTEHFDVIGVGKSTWINAFANYLYFGDLQSATASEQVLVSSLESLTCMLIDH